MSSSLRSKVPGYPSRSCHQSENRFDSESSRAAGSRLVWKQHDKCSDSALDLSELEEQGPFSYKPVRPFLYSLAIADDAFNDLGAIAGEESLGFQEHRAYVFGCPWVGIDRSSMCFTKLFPATLNGDSARPHASQTGRPLQSGRRCSPQRCRRRRPEGNRWSGGAAQVGYPPRSDESFNLIEERFIGGNQSHTLSLPRSRYRTHKPRMRKRLKRNDRQSSLAYPHVGSLPPFAFCDAEVYSLNGQ